MKGVIVLLITCFFSVTVENSYRVLRFNPVYTWLGHVLTYPLGTSTSHLESPKTSDSSTFYSFLKLEIRFNQLYDPWKDIIH